MNLFKVWFICLTGYHLFMGYLMPKFDSLENIVIKKKKKKKKRERERERERNREKLDLVYWFNGISIPHGLFNAKI